jgi:hypothetical protein
MSMEQMAGGIAEIHMQHNRGRRGLRRATPGGREEKGHTGERQNAFVHYVIISQLRDGLDGPGGPPAFMGLAWWSSRQSYANHARFDPSFHFFLLPLGLAAIVLSIIVLVRAPGIASALGVVLAIGLVMIAGKTRGYALKVQDRVIRLEERLRLSMLLPEAAKPRIAELTESQLIALRFASDAELPALAMRALNEGLTNKQIKTSIQNWRPDYFRV